MAHIPFCLFALQAYFYAYFQHCTFGAMLTNKPSALTCGSRTPCVSLSQGRWFCEQQYTINLEDVPATCSLQCKTELTFFPSIHCVFLSRQLIGFFPSINIFSYGKIQDRKRDWDLEMSWDKMRKHGCQNFFTVSSSRTLPNLNFSSL